MDPVTIIGGTGDLGEGLALRLGAAGVPVVIGSRDPQKAQGSARAYAERVPAGDFDGAHNPDAAARSPVVFLCVPFASQAATLGSLSLRAGQLLVDATVPLAAAVGGKPVRTLGVWQGSAAEQAAELAGDGVRVVSALHTVSASLLADLDHELGEDVLVCGDSKQDKRQVAELIERIPGLRCVDCGKLEFSRLIEQLTPLIIGINIRHKTRAGIRITGL